MFFDNFLTLCNKKGISPSAAGAEMGFHRSQISRWANSKSLPRRANLLRIADYFGVSVDDLLKEPRRSEKAPVDDREKQSFDLGNFYKNYLTFCNRVGKSPSAVALEVGLSKTAVNGWKHGRSNPTDATLEKLADYFSVSVDVLLADNEKENAPAQIESERDMEILENCKDLSNDEMQKVFAYIEGLKANRK